MRSGHAVSRKGLLPGQTTDPMLRFAELFTPEPNSGCWLWIGARVGKGYGGFYFNGKNTNAHKAAYLMFRGPVPDGMVLDHLCRVRCCVNPAHLEAVTHGENLRRGIGPELTRARARPRDRARRIPASKESHL